jgi:hypothetical protein
MTGTDVSREDHKYYDPDVPNYDHRPSLWILMIPSTTLVSILTWAHTTLITTSSPRVLLKHPCLPCLTRTFSKNVTDKQAEAEAACLKEEERATGREFDKKHHGIDQEQTSKLSIALQRLATTGISLRRAAMVARS